MTRKTMRRAAPKFWASVSASKRALAYLCLVCFVMAFLLFAMIPHNHDEQEGSDEGCLLCVLSHNTVKIAYIKSALILASALFIKSVFCSPFFLRYVQSLVGLKARMNN